MKGIIFQPELVGVLLERGSIQTRRIVKPQPDSGGLRWNTIVVGGHGGWTDVHGNPYTCPYGGVGDQIYVKEAHTYADVIRSQHDSDLVVVDYREHKGISIERRFCPVDEWVADEVSNWIADREVDGDGDNWRSPLFMPEWATRAKVEIANVRVERVQDITEDEAFAAGVQAPRTGPSEWGEPPEAVYEFMRLWDHINAVRGYSWESNPWVWVLDLKLVTT